MTTVPALTDDEINLRLAQLYPAVLAKKASVFFNKEGFLSFFEFITGHKPHGPGLKWVDNIFLSFDVDKGLLQEAFRESGKTTVFSVAFLAYYIGHHPWLSSKVIRVNDTKANETTSAVATIIKSTEKWRKVFPHVIPDEAKGWGANGYWVKATRLRHSGGELYDPIEDIGREYDDGNDKIEWISYNDNEWNELRASQPIDSSFAGYGWQSKTIIGGRISGLGIVDDIHDEENSTSETLMAKIKKFYTGTLEPMFMEGSHQIWNFTPWNLRDLYHYLMTTGEYVHSKTPLLIEDDELGELWPPDPQIPLSGIRYIITWPKEGRYGWDWKRIRKKYRRIGHLDFARMYMLDLKAAEGTILKGEWFDRSFPPELIKDNWDVLVGVDFASSKRKQIDKGRVRLDYFTASVAKVIPGENRLVGIDGIRKRYNSGEAQVALEGLAYRYPYLKVIGIEAIGGTTGSEFYWHMMTNSQLFIYSCRYPKPKGGKQNNFEYWLAPFLQFRKIRFTAAPNEYIRTSFAEWVGFGNGALHDDTIDAWLHLCWMAVQLNYVNARVPLRSDINEIVNPMLAFEKPKQKNPWMGIAERMK